MMISERARGFTLLEMLVVLLIAGMALALTTQALGQYQRAQTRAIANERAGREHRLSEAWFRDSVRGLHPAAPNDAQAARATTRLGMGGAAPVFSGSASGFTGVTLAPVLAGQGVPVLQAWRSVRDRNGVTRLELEEEGKTLQLSLPRAREIRLHYLDPEGKLHAQWPPRLGLWKQLPEAVLLELVPEAGGSGGALIASAVLGPRDPLDPMQTAYEPTNE